MNRLPPRLIPLTVVALLVVLASLASRLILDAVGLPLSYDEYNLAVWEVRHFPNKWLYEAGHICRGNGGREKEDAAIEQYLQMETKVSNLEAQVQQASATNAAAEDQAALAQQLRQARAERDRQQNKVESVMEGRISAIAAAQGLETSLPLFSRVHWLFPPVDFEFENPPYLLVISPRDHIEEAKATLLRSDLTLAEAQRLERDAEAKSDSVAALVVPTGGIGSYPTIIDPTDSYLQALQVASHEWLHDYLSFHPLGDRYFESDTLRTINETVADIAGEEMGTLAADAYPLPPTSTPTPQPAAIPSPDDVDVEQALRRLRLDVDKLLSEGKVSEAEAEMEQTRQFLADHGHYIRKINQAFFAFYGLYGTTGASSSPIGPKLKELRQRSASLGDFIRACYCGNGQSHCQWVAFAGKIIFPRQTRRRNVAADAR